MYNNIVDIIFLRNGMSLLSSQGKCIMLEA